MYQLINDTMVPGIIRIDDGTFIPQNEGNRDWQEYQAWLAADPDNQPLPADG